MIINGKNYRLTKHGRARFRERVAIINDDRLILSTAANGLPHYEFVFTPDRNDPTVQRLTTVYYLPTHPHYRSKPHGDIDRSNQRGQDRQSTT